MSIPERPSKPFGGTGQTNDIPSRNLLRAEYLYYYYYFFADQGIMRVQISSRKTLFGLFLVVLITLSTIFLLVEISIQPPLTVAAFILLSVVVGPFGCALLYDWTRKRRILSLGLRRLASRKSTVDMPWKSIDEIEVRNRQLRIHLGRKTYKVALREKSRDVIVDFLMSKAAEKISV
jgi:hypothetical protein